ncbi:MAG: tyrosine--tRNA ligase [Verrucomicrobiaceae bacterium]|nr:tyrosine--tRNA ligase [Verrucomicrobiaceae bacterium]
MDIFEDLKWRGLLSDYTRFADSDNADKAPQLPDLLAGKKVTLYCGFDPTADSLHVGSLVPLIALRRFQLAGHHPIAVAGGATGSIGDPSGKTQERQLLTGDQIKANVDAIKPQLARLLDFDTTDNPARLVDNADWFGPISFIDFLRDVGKHFTVNQMVAKESVRARMEDRDVGISYTEFSYMLLQAYDFYHLAEQFGCELQIGGSDQWGNITAGIDLVRKRLRKQGYGLTLPLITKADGTKFGKTESGTVWLDAKRTSVYQFYQFWINVDDRDVLRFLRYFTFLPHDQIEALDAAHNADPGKREAHRALAREMTTMLHGETACQAAIQAATILFGGSVESMEKETFAILRSEVPTATVTAEQLQAGIVITEALVAAKLTQSKGQARKDIEGGGVYINGERCADIGRALTAADLLHGEGVLLRKGKRAYAVVTVEG